MDDLGVRFENIAGEPLSSPPPAPFPSPSWPSVPFLQGVSRPALPFCDFLWASGIPGACAPLPPWRETGHLHSGPPGKKPGRGNPSLDCKPATFSFPWCQGRKQECISQESPMPSTTGLGGCSPESASGMEHEFKELFGTRPALGVGMATFPLNGTRSQRIRF